jgi:1-pyrroline-5-carboxylate dehydrogenase
MLRRIAVRAASIDINSLNEPLLNYAPGSAERAALTEAVKKVHSTTVDIPLVIGGKEIYDAPTKNQVSPYDHQNVIATYRLATEEHLNQAIESAMSARKEWERRPLADRAQIFMKAADKLANEYRPDITATTMAGQAKNAWQAEIDAACELIDFFRFNAHYALELEKSQPISPEPHILTNACKYRGLEGFVAAIAPFNFTAISGNLAGTPAMMGNVVLWKPSDTAVLSSWVIYQVLVECGLPKDIVQFVPADGPTFGKAVTASSDLAAINFTGSVPTFEWLWREVGKNISHYKGFPRLIGECGGKNSHFVHPSGDMGSVVAGTIRSAFEYQGQKCSACSRAYVPKSKWPEVKQGLLDIHKEIVVGRADEYPTFVSAVIDEVAFDRIAMWLDKAAADPECTIIAGGTYDKSVGYFIQPTIIECTNPDNPIMATELFGPVVAVHVYEDADWKEVAKKVPETSPYALTGGIYCKDEEDKAWLIDLLRESAGNFYVNDKSTGSVVGQQWFGGARKSGTNDKAGGPQYVAKWVSPQSVKTTVVDSHAWRYPSMDV